MSWVSSAKIWMGSLPQICANGQCFKFFSSSSGRLFMFVYIYVCVYIYIYMVHKPNLLRQGVLVLVDPCSNWFWRYPCISHTISNFASSLWVLKKKKLTKMIKKKGRQETITDFSIKMRLKKDTYLPRRIVYMPCI